MAAGTASTEGWSSSSQDSVALGDKPAAVADKLVVLYGVRREGTSTHRSQTRRYSKLRTREGTRRRLQALLYCRCESGVCSIRRG